LEGEGVGFEGKAAIFGGEFCGGGVGDEEVGARDLIVLGV